MKSNDLPAWPDRVAYALLLLVIAAIPWPWGSVGAAAQSGTLLLIGVALLFAVLPSGAGRWPRGRAFRLGVVGWLLWLAWLAVSLVPLPEAMLAWLSPAAVSLHQGVTPLGLEPVYTLSVEPAASRADLLASIGLLGLYLLAARCVQGESRRRGLLMVMALVAGLQALYGLGMTLTGSEIGFFERKVFGRGWATGTFINRNHFSHLLALGAAAALALLLAWKSEPSPVRGWRGQVLRLLAWLMSPALVWRVLLLVLLAAVVLSQSRMGNVAFMVALVFGVLLWTVLHNRARLATAMLLLGSFAVADVWIVSHYYGLERVVQRLDETELQTEQRAIALRDLTPLLQRYQLTGAGGGSFQSLFLATQSEALEGLYDHAHNEYAEFAIEHGLPGLLWLLLMGALHAGHAFRVLRYRRGAGTRAIALAGATALVAAALHAGTDFILHIPALRIWLVVLMGSVAAATAATYARHRREAPPQGVLAEPTESGFAQ